jgi:Fur family transcriptional regulator, ferric uptake regulator
MDEKSLSPRAQRLRDTGHKLTNARLTVLEVIEVGGGHMTSTEILDRVNDADSTIGRASVFRALDLFTRLSIIRPTYIESSITPTYVMLPNGHHHHIICTNCNRVIEFDDCGLSVLENHLESELGVRLSGHLLEFYGLCDRCNRE